MVIHLYSPGLVSELGSIILISRVHKGPNGVAVVYEPDSRTGRTVVVLRLFESAVLLTSLLLSGRR